MAGRLSDNYILIGPDVWKETRKNPDFAEDPFLFRSWRVRAESEGLKFKIGRWNIEGNPLVILADFSPFITQKDKILAGFWETYRLDSISGQWDYLEPALFGYAAGRIIESFYEFYLTSQDKLATQFHEWMTGTGVLYLREKVPQAATVLTTHATVLGRCIAGNGLPLYSGLGSFSPEGIAQSMNVTAKFSLEKIAAAEADAFTTVSDITAAECSHFLSKPVDVVTPNGFDDAFVPDENQYHLKRNGTRSLLLKVAGLLAGREYSDENTLLVLNSGRYEFHNKGIDLFIDALGNLTKQDAEGKDIVAFIAVPANHAGARSCLVEALKGNVSFAEACRGILTHDLHDDYSDPVLNRVTTAMSSAGKKVQVVFVPCYLDGQDGIFDLSYYDFLIGFDLTVFPSYYEPWGYTPLESIAFSIPTVTTSLAGFGLWVRQTAPDAGNSIVVITRTDNNPEEVVKSLSDTIGSFARLGNEQTAELRKIAHLVSRGALWENLCEHYLDAYHIALLKAADRFEQYKAKVQTAVPDIKLRAQSAPSWKKILVRQGIPESFSALGKLTRNLWWAWNYEAQELFSMINKVQWERCGRNPISLLQTVSLRQLSVLEKNPVFMEKLGAVSDKFNEYMAEACKKQGDLIAYFSMEFGLHDSLKTYSGGLGILAGDYLKEASDSNRNILGISLLYRYGYFDQNISLLGDQVATYHPQKYSHLPLIPVRRSTAEDNDASNWLRVSVALPGRTLHAKVWKVEVGRAQLYLLDTDIDENSTEDRAITHRLYGGDSEMRLKQELLLGVGGIRMLDQLGLKPHIYHCNEGHAAFMGVERLRKYVQERNLSFYEAVEAVRSSTLFTTHTPVPAGHDRFAEDLLRTYIPHYADRLRISWETFMNLGKMNENDPSEKYNMSVLAVKLSSEVNGVSRLHGKVTREMLAPMYPGYFPEELHIGHVTNGVHFPTWVSGRWRRLYDQTFDPGYIGNQSKREYWKKIYDVPDAAIWEIRQHERHVMIEKLRRRLVQEMTDRQDNPRHIFRVSETLSDRALTIGFARRFATYKRGALLFKNPERLASILNNPAFPVQIVYAGKAHPNDGAGQDLIRRIYDIAKQPEFVGKIVFVENYDIDLGKTLTRGVDLWLNTPTRPMEASGTSGMKAVMNGVLNFSVLDGWWAEGYRADAGWALREKRTYKNQDAQDALDAETIYSLLEHEIIPAFYTRNSHHVPEKWVERIKNTIAQIAPDYTMKRMMDDYYRKYYSVLGKRRDLICRNQYENARLLSAWKLRMLRNWEGIEVLSLRTTDSDKKALSLGETFFAELILKINGIDPHDLGIEILFGQKNNDVVEKILYKHEMLLTEQNGGEARYYFGMPARFVGVFDYAIRVFPRHPLVPYHEDFNLMMWI